MGEFFHSAIYQPLYNVLVFFYNVVPGQDFGVAIILTTVLLKTLFIPLSKKQIESQKKLQELQPKIKEIQNKYKDNKEKQTKEIMEFYKKNKTNPFSGCLPLIVQLIFLIAIYRILFNICANLV
jgi:YidC/Oxa1 family membrane protein insertase